MSCYIDDKAKIWDVLLISHSEQYFTWHGNLTAPRAEAEVRLPLERLKTTPMENDIRGVLP